MSINAIVWGTGRIAKRFLPILETCNEEWQNLPGNITIDISLFIDRDVNKSGTLFNNRPVILPEEYDWSSRDELIIVAVAQADEIYDYLESKKKRIGRDFVSFRPFFCGKGVAIGFFLERCIELWGVGDIAAFEPGKECPKGFTKENVNRIRQSILIREVLEKYWENRTFDVYGSFETNGLAATVGALAIAFNQNYLELYKVIGCVENKDVQRQIKTIGIYYPKMYNGGTEKVVSLLCPILLEHGYKIYLINEIIDEKLEYEVPEGVIRLKLPEYDGHITEWFEGMERIITEYNIDLVMSHSGFHWQNYYLGMLVNMMDVHFLLEIHFIFIVEFLSQKRFYSSEYYKQKYKFAERLVVLTEADKHFWNGLGIKSCCILNPIEPLQITHDYKKRANSIIWIARVEVFQKRVWDLPEIMKLVVAEVPDAHLNVVGMVDLPGERGEKVMRHLTTKIEEYGLKDNITFCGYHTDVLKYYGEAEVMLVTSRYEGYSLVIVEGKQFGLPLVMYEMPYLETVKDKKGFLAAKQGNIEEISNLLVKVLKDRGLQKKLSQEAKESAKNLLEYNVGEKWEQVFEQMEKGTYEADNICNDIKSIESLLIDTAEYIESVQRIEKEAKHDN